MKANQAVQQQDRSLVECRTHYYTCAVPTVTHNVCREERSTQVQNFYQEKRKLHVKFTLFVYTLHSHRNAYLYCDVQKAETRFYPLETSEVKLRSILSIKIIIPSRCVYKQILVECIIAHNYMSQLHFWKIT